MPYSKSLAARVRQVLGNRRGLVEKRLFGGVGFMLAGNLLVAIWHDALIARLGIEDGAAALREDHVRAFDVTGRPMRGWVMVDAEGIDTDAELHAWIERALAFVETLPPK